MLACRLADSELERQTGGKTQEPFQTVASKNKEQSHAPLGEVEVVESDRTAERVLHVHLQDVPVPLFFTLLSWDAV